MLHVPQKLGAVITATEPWESWGVFAYNTVIQVGDEMRMYYDCAAALPGLVRFVCFANSTDGIHWEKPHLGLATFQNSTENNIIFPFSEDGGYVEPGTVAFAEDGTWLMAVRWKKPGGDFGTYMLNSTDGLHFAPMFETPSLSGSDTKNVFWYDECVGKYVGYMRIDSQSPKEHPSPCHGDGLSEDERRIGRCYFSDLAKWCADEPELVFTFDKYDPECFDVYTNSASRYPPPYASSTTKPAATEAVFAMAAFYSHIDFSGFSNDGLVETRLLMARSTAESFTYPASSRVPWIPLGHTRCGTPPVPGIAPHRYLWCNDSEASLAPSDFDSSTTYAASGFVFTDNGASVLAYYSGSVFTHGEDAGGVRWGRNATGIGAVRLRRDGFVSLKGAYNFTSFPNLVTTPLTVPNATIACPHPTSLRLTANLATSIAGFAYFELRYATNGTTIPGKSFDDSDPIRGDWLQGQLYWSGSGEIDALAGESIVIAIEFPDADLYSIQFSCV